MNQPATLEAPDEEDWFGEGSAFDSGEDLAAALFAMAGAGHSASRIVATLPERQVPEAPVPTPDVTFQILDARLASKPQWRVPATAEADVTQAPLAWAVRNPDAEVLPPRTPGRSGWTIRNSVQLLRRTESVMQRLREDAVVTTFAAAARAFSPDG